MLGENEKGAKMKDEENGFFVEQGGEYLEDKILRWIGNIAGWGSVITVIYLGSRFIEWMIKR
jgi:hypothetical protein